MRVAVATCRRIQTENATRVPIAGVKIKCMREDVLEASVDINQPPASSYGATALPLAAVTGQVGIAKLLVKQEADINAPGSKVGGRTALEAAAEHGRLDMAQMLLESDVETNGQEN